MDKPEAVQEVLPNDAAQTVSVAETTETQESGLQNVTNSKETIDNNVSPGDDPTVTSENGAHPESSEEKPGNAVAPGNESAPPPENGAGLVVTVCGTTEAREEVCVTVCGEEGEREGEKKRSETLPNGKPSSATFPRQHRHNYSFSSTHSGRLSPYGSEGQSSSSASLSQDTSYSPSQHTVDLHLVVEQLKHDLLSRLGIGEKVRERGEGEDLTKTLLELVVTLKMELASVKEENERLRHVRSNMDNEIHELTENLFEEAYKMVDKAKGGKVSAEKRLADAAGKMDAMETEMSTLKRIIHSSQQPQTQSSSSRKGSTSSLSLPHSHSPSQHQKRSSIKRAVHKIQKRTGLGAPKSPVVSTSRVMPLIVPPLMLLEHRGGLQGESLVTGEIDQEEYSRFHHWIRSLSLTPPSPSTPTPSPHPQPSLHPYLTSILEQDVTPCLSFKNTEVSKRVLHAVQENLVIIEALQPIASSNGHPGHVRSSSLPPEGVLCALCEAKERDCTHKMRLGEAREWLFISQSCRDRVAAVCDFFMTIGHIQKGIIKADTTKLYWQVARLRGLMQLSRYSLSLPPDVPPSSQ